MDAVFTPPQLTTLVAVIDRIIPGDDFPSASQNQVPRYLQKLLSAELRKEKDLIAHGLDAIEAESVARFRRPVVRLSETELDDLLKQLEAGNAVAAWAIQPAIWFERLVTLTQEGYYADPQNGANPDRASWRMVGYDPRRPL